MTNAFQSREFKVAQTNGHFIWHYVNVLDRGGYGDITYVPFFDEAEK